MRLVHHPDKALRPFAERVPDIALLGIGLPSMDVYELARRMRGQARRSFAQFVALTGQGLAADQSKAADAGLAAHIVKPISLEQLELLFNEVASTN